MAGLNSNELEALRVLWERGESKPADIQDDFSWAIDNGTLRSVLRVLMDKDHVARRKSGKAYLYKAKQSRHGVLSNMAKRMAYIFAGGSTTGLIAQLIEAERLSEKDIEELRRIAAGKPKTERKTNRRGKRA